MIKGNKMQFIHQSSSTYTKKSIMPCQSTTLWSKDHMLVVKWTPIYPFWTEDVPASPVNLIITIWNVEEPVH